MAEGINFRNIVDFLKGRQDVASLYVFGLRKSYTDADRELGIGVLMDDSADFSGGVDTLDMGGWDLSDDFPHWPGSVVLLNTAPAFLQHHVVRKGSVVYDGDTTKRLRFTEQAINNYLDQISDEHFHNDYEEPMLELDIDEFDELEDR